MENRIALLGIIAEQTDCAEALNSILHEYSPYIIGRMGLPYRDRGCYIISVIVDAPNSIISALSGKIGRMKGVQIKTIYSKTGENS